MAIDEEPEPDRPQSVYRGEDDPRWRVTPTKIVVTIILVAAIVLPLLTWTYSRDSPRLFGFPFFYWYQFIWVFLAAGACYLCYVLLRREARAHQAGHPTTLTPPTAPPPGDASSDVLADNPADTAAADQRKAE
ncbi:hypothetical protein GCM10011575_12780 [Microlunatus endophyticus]|uniref:Uncharacterized protein n=1 Tax=Microlunatus endophyticus TaxID=1716077 RepID=A0A917W1D4_9ACTN|nr:DUF3311 domain-containing protein [Microlunatus endophyticus]GGL55818.1 hypothetical protein GCM10011575_12780 [Microlunatus endophyticus]